MSRRTQITLGLWIVLTGAVFVIGEPLSSNILGREVVEVWVIVGIALIILGLLLILPANDEAYPIIAECCECDARFVGSDKAQDHRSTTGHRLWFDPRRRFGRPF